jgi:hypothetical protein
MTTPATKRKAVVTKSRDVRIHAELWHTANCLLRAGQEEPKGSAHQFRGSLVFRAFALESFLNWLGYNLVPHWKYLERLKPREKLDLLTDLTHVTPDYGKRPWQIVKELFDFRNEIAHGKPENLTSETLEEVDDDLDTKLGEHIQADWERFGTEQNAVKAQEDVEKIASILYNASGVAKKQSGPRAPFAFGFHTHGATIKQP